MKITIISQCTGKKAVSSNEGLTLDDFRLGAAHVAVKSRALIACTRTAETMYTGEQHLRLLRGVQAARTKGAEVNLWIVSAGYGLVNASNQLCPYEATFNTMTKQGAQQWADTLRIPEMVRDVLSEPADLAIVLLGDRYLEAARLGSVDVLGAPTLAVCSQGSAARFSKNIQLVLLDQSDTSRFRVGMIGLKGEVAGRMLAALPERLSLDALSQMPITN